MHELDWEIMRISSLFPQVGIGVIKDFMTNIPQEVEYLRIPLTLTHFYKLEDNQNILKLREENIQHAGLIHDLFPIYSVEKIMKKLKKYGNIPERCRLVIRNILKGREEEITSALLNAQQSSNIYFKEQGHSTDQHNDSDRNMELADMSLNLQKTVEQQERVCDTPQPTLLIDEIHRSGESFETIITSPHNPELLVTPPCSENFHILGDQSNELDVSSLLWERDSSEEKVYPVETSETNKEEETYIFPTFPEVSSEILSELNKPEDVVCERNCVIPQTETSNNISSVVVIQPSGLPLGTDLITEVDKQIEALPIEACELHQTATQETHQEPLSSEPSRKKLKVEHLNRMEEAPEHFDLIEFLAEISSKSRRSIADYCLRRGIDVYRKPTERQMHKLLNFFVDEVSDDDSDYDDVHWDIDDAIIVATSPKQEEADVVHVSKAEKTHPKQASKIANELQQIENGNTAAKVTRETNNSVIFRVMEIFPDADPDYIRRLYCQMSDEAGSEKVLSEALIEKMLSVDNYPKRPVREPSPEAHVDFENQVEFVRELLPDADPSFLRIKVSELKPDELRAFVAEALEKKDYPTLKEYLRKQQLSAQMRQYTVEFSVENFVKLVPDPVQTFQDPKRTINLDKDDVTYVNQFFRNEFCCTSVKTIHNEWSRCRGRPYVCYKNLLAVKGNLKNTRRKGEMDSLTCKNIPLLQELAFIQHETEILSYISELALRKEQERERIKNAGLMFTCNCCCEEDIMPDDTHRCSNNCVYCRKCIIRSVEVAFGEGKLVFPCLGDCGSNFSLQNLQEVLPPNLFSKVAQKHALAEVKAAGIEDLEYCPFCDFATIPPGLPETNKIFVCQNPECLKESCRLCKEPSHVPLRCDELEKDEEVKKRVYIENKMTEALLRKCWKCGVSFYKEEGCNKMTCSCGATMCYICGSKVTDYKHFNGMGGDRHDLCPLYSDTNTVNQENVLKGAQAAKEELGVAGSSELKNDPTADVKKHFEERAKKLPPEPHMQHLLRLNEMAEAIRLRDQFEAFTRRMAELHEIEDARRPMRVQDNENIIIRAPNEDVGMHTAVPIRNAGAVHRPLVVFGHPARAMVQHQHPRHRHARPQNHHDHRTCRCPNCVRRRSQNQVFF